jgi:hypothetical protein
MSLALLIAVVTVSLLLGTSVGYLVGTFRSRCCLHHGRRGVTAAARPSRGAPAGVNGVTWTSNPDPTRTQVWPVNSRTGGRQR